jgi:hypothetical protein
MSLARLQQRKPTAFSRRQAAIELAKVGKRKQPPSNELQNDLESNKQQKHFHEQSISVAPATVFFKKTKSADAIAVHGVGPTIFQEQSYEMLTHTLPITESSKLSCRGGARETILIDCQSAELKKYFSAFMALCKAQTVDTEAATQPADELADESVVLAPPYDLQQLQALVAFVRSQFLSITELELLTIVQQQKVVLLEMLWEAHRGFCRHQALASAYLLVNLIDFHAKQQGKTFADTESKVYRFRTTLHLLANPKKTASHAVIIYEAENGHRYLLDPTRETVGVVADLTHLSATDKLRLHNLYAPYDGNAFIEQIIDTYDEVSLLHHRHPCLR